MYTHNIESCLERRKPRSRMEWRQRLFYRNLIEAFSEMHFIKVVEILTFFIPERKKLKENCFDIRNAT